MEEAPESKEHMLQNGEGKKESSLVDPGDIALVLAQYLNENRCYESLHALQRELRFRYRVIEDKKTFIEKVRQYKFDQVLETIKTQRLTLRKETTALLHELIIVDLCERNEEEAAKKFFLASESLQYLKEKHLPRYKVLIRAIQRKSIIKLSERTEQVDALAELLNEELVNARPNELLRLIGDAVKWQKLQNSWPKGAGLLGRYACSKDESDRPYSNLKIEPDTKIEGVLQNRYAIVRFGKDTYAECCAFSPDGVSIATGSADGFIEIWDYNTGKLRMDLKYQQAEELMMHNSSVLSIKFNQDGSLLVSGCKKGTIKVWRVNDGACLAKLKKAHIGGALSVVFGFDQTVLSGGVDFKVKLFGLKSGNMLKEFTGHTSYVNDVQFYGEKAEKIISASSDATLRVWQSDTTTCIHVITLDTPNAAEKIAINNFAILDNGNLLVCNRSDTLYQIEKEDFAKTSQAYSTKDVHFVSMKANIKGDSVYACTMEGKILCFSLRTGARKALINFGENEPKELLGIDINREGNRLAVFSLNGPLVLLR